MEFNGLLDLLIDDRVEAYGVDNTIAYFLDCGLSVADLVTLRFDVDDVMRVEKEQKRLHTFETGITAAKRWIAENYGETYKIPCCDINGLVGAILEATEEE